MLSKNAMKEVEKLDVSYFPKTLYKYMSFKDYTAEMIKDNYLYLSPVELMDKSVKTYKLLQLL